MASGLPIRLPSLDIHTIGAGGGSLAGLDPGGALVVGPASAGADPGPACYGRGGTRPTVTDADLVLGRIPPGLAFGGLDVLDREAADTALACAGVTAEGVVAVVDAAMERAVRAVSVERGVDPAGLALVAFGGAGPLHACAIAEGTGIGAVVIPPRAGVLSAVGLLCSPRQRDLVRSWPTPGEHSGIDAALADLAAQARAAVAEGRATETETDAGRVDASVEISTSLDCRYTGQSHELTVAGIDDFGDEHLRRNGYSRPGATVEVMALRARARMAGAVDITQLGPPPAPRQPIEGPAVVAEADCTVWVPEGWSGRVEVDGSWVLTRRLPQGEGRGR